MSTKRTSLTEVVGHTHSSNVGMSFPADLLYPNQSQVAQHGDAVSERIVRLDLHAQRLGEGFGIPLTDFVLNPPITLDPKEPTTAALAVLERLIVPEERVSLERKAGRWGLYFVRGSSYLTREQRTEAVPLRDAPLDVRERFLRRSQEFFRKYLQVCENRLGTMKGAVDAADETIRLLEQVSLR